MVMACHSFLSFGGLAWPVRRIASLGWYGVQLFFMASTLTLLLSWHHREETHKVAKFFVRRFFRIWPMYFVMFLFYAAYTPPGANFSLSEIFTTLSFTNGWTPFTMPTLPHAWSPVPGNWSIAAEFGFYATLPWLANFLLSKTRYAIIFFVFTTLMAVYYNSVFQIIWGDTAGWSSISQFIYYWLPNQMPVFMLGAIAYHLISRYRETIFSSGKHAIWLSFLGMAGFISLGYTPWHQIATLQHWAVPTHWLASLALVSMMCGVSGGVGILNNWITRSIGRVSFSAYLVHFAVIDWLSSKYGIFFHLGSTGVVCLVYAGLFFGCVVLITYLISLFTYEYIEKQGIALGKIFCEFL
jgi:peptidoglycan/LPS O-acetylase OafA/YrhL